MAARNLPRAFRPYSYPSCAKSLQRKSREYATAASSDIYDVICVGGGPAGLSLLTALRKEVLCFFNHLETDLDRLFQSYLSSQTRPHRIARPCLSPELEPTPRSVLKSRKLPYASVSLSSGSNWSMVSYRYLSCPSLSAYARLG